MNKLIVEIAAASALTLGAVIALASGAHAACPALKVIDAFARASATPLAKTGAVYFSLVNQSAGETRLVSVATARAERTMLHETKLSDGVASMVHIESIALPPGARVDLAPGGTHVMLTGLTAPLKRGESIPITLTFENGCSVTADVPVGSVAQAAADGG